MYDIIVLSNRVYERVIMYKTNYEKWSNKKWEKVITKIDKEEKIFFDKLNGVFHEEKSKAKKNFLKVAQFFGWAVAIGGIEIIIIFLFIKAM